VDRDRTVEPLDPEDALMPFHAEVMPDTQERMLKALGTFTDGAGFVLAGGTAVATARPAT
jgi:hypothetical protein